MDRASSSTTTRVLVVEPDDALRDTLTMALQVSGYEVEAAHSAARGHTLLSGHVYDAVIVDVMMESDEIGGFDLVEVVTLPVVAVSAVSDPVVEQQALEAGAAVFLPKPFTLSELRQALQQATAA